MNDALITLLRIMFCVCWWEFVWKLIPISNERQQPGRRCLRALLLVTGLLGGLIIARSTDGV